MSQLLRKFGVFALNNPLVDIALFVGFLYGKHLLLYKEMYIPDSQYFTNEAKIFTISLLLSVALFFIFQSSFSRKIGLSVIAFLISALLFTDTLYYRHFEDITSLSIIYQAGHLADVSGTITELLMWKDGLFFLDLFLIPLLMFLFRKQISRVRVKRKAMTHFVHITLSCMFLYGSISFSLIEAGYSGVQNRNTNSLASAIMGNLNFHIVESMDFIVQRINQPTLTDKEISEINRSFQNDIEGESTVKSGILEGHNVLFVQMESFSHFLLDMVIEGEEITPNLNKLQKENLSAKNFYTQIGNGHTSDSEIVAMTSMYGLAKGSASVLYGTSEYHTLPDILKENGYSTLSAHAYRKEFWNRVNLHPSLGFEKSLFEEDFVIEERAGYGMKDDDFFMQTVERISDLPQPFFSYLITLQHHTPYTGGDTSFRVGELEGTMMGRFIQSAHEADKAMGVLMNELEAKGLLDNTLIVLYGDHDGELEKEEYERLGEQLEYNDLFLKTKVPFIMIAPDNKLQGVITKPIGQLDILPTTLHLLGITPEYDTFYGEDIFIVNPDKVTRAVYHWYAGETFILRKIQGNESTYLAFDVDTGKEIPVTETMLSTYMETERQLMYSDKVIRSDGMKKILDYQKKEGKPIEMEKE